jgi:hypothetical protein
MNRNNKKFYIGLIVLLCCYGFLSTLLTAWEQGITIDENIYRVAGLSYWKTHSFMENFEHPPFSKVLGAVFAFVFKNEDSIFLFRLPHVLLFLLAGIYISYFLWARVGPPAALVWAALFNLCPNTKAMASLDVNDFDVAIFIVLCAMGLWSITTVNQRDRFRSALFSSAFFLGFAMLSKYTALFYVPFYFLLYIVFAPKKFSLKSNFGIIVGAILFAFTISYLGNILQIHWYGKGIDAQRLHDRMANHPSSILGTVSTKGFWYYYLLSFFCKTPLTTLFLLIWGCVVVIKENKKLLWFFMIPSLSLLLYLSKLNVQTGLRYFLPGILLFYWVAAWGVGHFFKTERRKSYLGILVVAIFALWVDDVLTLRKDTYLTFFNLMAPTPTSRKFGDSNNDWGQGLSARVRKRFPPLLYINELNEKTIKEYPLKDGVYVFAGANDLIGFWSVRAKELVAKSPKWYLGGHEIFWLDINEAKRLSQIQGRP